MNSSIYKLTFNRRKHFVLNSSFLLRFTTVLIESAILGIAFSTYFCFCFKVGKKNENYLWKVYRNTMYLRKCHKSLLCLIPIPYLFFHLFPSFYRLFVFVCFILSTKHIAHFPSGVSECWEVTIFGGNTRRRLRLPAIGGWRENNREP